MVPGQRREFLRQFNASGHDTEYIGRECLSHGLREQFREPGRQFARFDHHAVAGGKCFESRFKREIERVVPWADDADHALGLRHDQATTRLKSETRRDRLGSHPGRQMALDVTHGIPQRHDVGHPGFVGRAMPKILRNGFCIGLAMLHKEVVDGPNPAQSRGKIRIRFPARSLAKLRKL